MIRTARILVAAPTVIKSKFGLTCPKCKKVVPLGGLIGKNQGDPSWSCVDCAKGLTSQPIPTKKPTSTPAQAPTGPKYYLENGNGYMSLEQKSLGAHYDNRIGQYYTVPQDFNYGKLLQYWDRIPLAAHAAKRLSVAWIDPISQWRNPAVFTTNDGPQGVKRWNVFRVLSQKDGTFSLRDAFENDTQTFVPSSRNFATVAEALEEVKRGIAFYGLTLIDFEVPQGMK